MQEWRSLVLLCILAIALLAFSSLLSEHDEFPHYEV